MVLAESAADTPNIRSKSTASTKAAKCKRKPAKRNRVKSRRPGSRKQQKARIGRKKDRAAKKVSARPRRKNAAIPPKSALEPCEAATSILVVGDSLAVGLGMTLSNVFEGVCKVRVKPMGKVSSGLDSPAFYDWQQVLEKTLDAERFDLVVLMLGANDAHNSDGSQAWGWSYELKFTELLRIPMQKKITTIVVGLPPMRDSNFCERIKVTNIAIRNASALFPENCVYVDAFGQFADEHGDFTETMLTGGEWKKIRASDGVHFTGTGYALLSKTVVNAALQYHIVHPQQ